MLIIFTLYVHYKKLAKKLLVVHIANLRKYFEVKKQKNKKKHKYSNMPQIDINQTVRQFTTQSHSHKNMFFSNKI